MRTLFFILIASIASTASAQDQASDARALEEAAYHKFKPTGGIPDTVTYTSAEVEDCTLRRTKTVRGEDGATRLDSIRTFNIAKVVLRELPDDDGVNRPYQLIGQIAEGSANIGVITHFRILPGGEALAEDRVSRMTPEDAILSDRGDGKTFYLRTFTERFNDLRIAPTALEDTQAFVKAYRHYRETYCLLTG